jgi:hypothetical protein
MPGPVITLGDLASFTDTPEASHLQCETLERGGILVLPRGVMTARAGIDAQNAVQLDLSQEDRSFLSNVQRNVSFRSKREEMRGFGDDLHRARMRHILERYANDATRLVERLLTPYAGHLHPGFTAFRAEEEQGRKNSAGKRSDLLHVNAFPDLPTWGGRILRVFTNLNEHRPRVWEIGEGFEHLAARYIGSTLKQAGDGKTRLDRLAKKLRSYFPNYEFRLSAAFEQHSDYDRFMLRLHDWMEESAEFQRSAKKERVEFAPGASWLVFTDAVPHAVVSGKFALDQTILVDRTALVAPEAAPITILERLCGKKLA